MRKVIAAINMTLDGFCDHTAIIPDEQMHQHYTDLLDESGVVLYGRITYQLMEYWPTVLKEPTGIRETDDFAHSIDRIPKVVFSRTLETTNWDTARIATNELKEEVLALKQEEGKDILVGSPSLIIALTQLGLIDEYQLCLHPVIAGGGMPLFKNINERVVLSLVKTKTFNSGAIILYYHSHLRFTADSFKKIPL
ncbi:dihydrofolate reductase family protein [Flavobacterium amniphilum]|uniref:dihydrofolate reductase family protein n=1 Tax=Flavobacterium amniphilum TaxID=1834035 RepID=UPI002029D162|nr:dihydrofolate reductase family protein [Flavobacterium amniphilum]MCL9806648.1 dihydrofolate reductase family protein [Flavobacterium amniphilum]